MYHTSNSMEGSNLISQICLYLMGITVEEELLNQPPYTTMHTGKEHMLYYVLTSVYM